MGLSAWIQRCSVLYCAVLCGCDYVFVSFVYSHWVGGVCCVLGRPLEPRRPELSQTRLLPSWWLWLDTGEVSQDLKEDKTANVVALGLECGCRACTVLPRTFFLVLWRKRFLYRNNKTGGNVRLRHDRQPRLGVGLVFHGNMIIRPSGASQSTCA